MPHIHELYDYVVSFGLVYKDQILLIKHRKYDNRWLAPGGHIELDEDPQISLLKEIEEETGYEPKQLTIIKNEKLARPKLEGGKQIAPPLDIFVHEAGKGHQHIGLIYGFLVDSPDFRHYEREHLETAWFNRDRLESMNNELPQQVRETAIFILDLAKMHST